MAVPLGCVLVLLQQYIREASNSVQVQLFTCECWVEPRGHGQESAPPRFAIPFFQSVEIGQSAVDRHLAASVVGDSTPSSLLAARDSRLMVTFQRMGLAGEVVC